MLLSLSWLRRYFTADLSAQQIAQLLQDAGVEVDSIREIRPAFSGIIVGRVERVEKHPNADRLVVASVFNGKDTLQVVCGAPNCRAGLLVPFAPVGSRIGRPSDPNSFLIKQAQLRGVDSFGMLAAADELDIKGLGIEDESAGLLELDPSCVPGQSFDALFTDDVLELSLTPDFGHALSIIGIARLLCARTGSTFEPPVRSFELLEEVATLKDSWKVQIESPELCPRYSALVLSHVSGAQTPLWMKLLLERSGIRVLNPLVDCVNFVMIALGSCLCGSWKV